MNSNRGIMNFLEDYNTQLILLALAVLRVYLEIIKFDFNVLPLTSKMDSVQSKKFHRVGLFFSLCYILFTATGILLS